MLKLQAVNFSNHKTFLLFTDTTEVSISSASDWSNRPESKQYLAATLAAFHIAAHNQKKLILTVPSLRAGYNVWSDRIPMRFCKSQESWSKGQELIKALSRGKQSGIWKCVLAVSYDIFIRVQNSCSELSFENRKKNLTCKWQVSRNRRLK